jgi:WD40 repeat protein
MIRITATTWGLCCLALCLLGAARTGSATESEATGAQQAAVPVPPASRLSWSPDAKNLAVVTTDSSIWIIKPPDYKSAKRLTGPVESLGTVQWSPDGRWLLVQGERPSDKRPDYPWGTLWLIDPEGNSPQRDLLPPGSAFTTPGRRWIGNTGWLDKHRVFFSMACGTSCLGHYSVDVNDGTYKIFCIGSGDIEWAPDRTIAVAENYSNGITRQGLGLVLADSGVALATGSTPYQYDRTCKSVFSGGIRTSDTGEIPAFIAWLPDSRRVLYSNGRDDSLRIWDAQTGQRTTLIKGRRP